MSQPELYAHQMPPNAGEHLDADTLAALGEQALSAPRRELVFAHLAECEICRECLAAHSALRDFEWKPATNGAAHPFRLLSMNAWRMRTAVGIACALLCFGLICGQVLRMKAPTPLAPRLSSAISVSNEPRLPVISTSVSRVIADAQLSMVHSRKAFNRAHIAAWRKAWFQPVRLTTATFNDPRPPFPGPLGQARLTRHLNFAANFSIEEARLPSFNQIAVRTTLGERWITLNRFSSSVWARF